VYGTGFSLPGPPADLGIVSTTTNSIYINWTSPVSTNGQLQEYHVSMTLQSSHHPTSGRRSPLLQRFSSSATSARLGDLLPGSKYKVEVAAVSQEGVGPSISKEVWTEVGEPEVPRTPTLVQGQQTPPGQMLVKLEPVEARGGPITAYQVIVLDASLHRSFQPTKFINYNAAEEAGLPYWVAAQLRPEQLERTFLVGDNKLYGGFWNHKLPSGKKWKVGLAVVSKLNGKTKRSYSGDQNVAADRTLLIEEQQGNELSENSEGSPSSVVVGLTVATVLAAVLLLGAVAVFVYLRHSLGTRFRRRGDTQELTAQLPTQPIDLESSGGYIGDGSYTNEVMRTAEEYLESLRGKVWLIPKNFVEASGDVLGQGRFGSVVRATVSSQGGPIPCNTQVIPRMQDEHLRKNMLKDLDIAIKAGQHPSLVCLVGICEEAASTLVVMEHGEPSLKQWLLGSRALDHQPQYAARHGRVATAREELLLELVAGLASGLHHLHQLGIFHGTVCARNVFMVGETGAKLGGFGMSTWSKPGEQPDCTRWMATEALMNNQSGVKCDVWSLGVLLWETVTLGGTPFSTVATKEVAMRVARGLRLPRVSGLSDQLYQLMLACWMTDPDERPSAEELNLMLADLARGGGMELDFSLGTGDFQYYPYLPDQELSEMSQMPRSTLL